MGRSSSPADLTRKIRQAGGAINGAARDGVFKSALLVKASVMSELRTTRLSGVGKRGAKVGVRFNVRGRTNPTVLIGATGPFHLIERDTRAHTITPKRKRRAIVIPGVGPRAYAKHPGTRGKHPWRSGVNKAIPRVGRVMREEQFDSLRRFFG